MHTRKDGEVRTNLHMHQDKVKEKDSSIMIPRLSNQQQFSRADTGSGTKKRNAGEAGKFLHTHKEKVKEKDSSTMRFKKDSTTASACNSAYDKSCDGIATFSSHANVLSPRRIMIRYVTTIMHLQSTNVVCSYDVWFQPSWLKSPLKVYCDVSETGRNLIPS